jgi:hypothetical protein
MGSWDDTFAMICVNGFFGHRAKIGIPTIYDACGKQIVT